MAGPLTLGEIVQRLGGRVAGDANTLVHQVASLEGASAGHISFFTGSRYRAQLAATRAAAVVLGPEAEAETRLPRIVAENPYAYFARLSQLFNPVVLQEPGIHPSAVVAKSARLGARTAIAGCTGIAGSADIGRHCTIGGAAIILGHLRIADHVNISAGTLISRSILKPGTYTGVYPFDEHASWARAAAGLRRKGKKNG